MNSKTLVITGVAAALAIASFLLLNWRAPYVEPVERLKPSISADKVFGTDISTAPAAEAAPVQVQAPAPEPISEPAPAAVAEVTATTPEAPAEPFAEPAMEIAEPFAAAAPETAPEAAAESTAEAPAKPAKKKSRQPLLPQADAMETWWPRQPIAGQLNLVYAGQVEDRNAVALVFDGNLPDAAGISSHVEVVGHDGKAVEGNWSLGRSNRLVSLAVPRKGRYAVFVKPGLKDAQGKAMTVSLHGPVYVR